MNLLADESVDYQIVARLRLDGHVVLYIAEMDAGITDDRVLAISISQSMVLMTQDKDFGELVYRQKLAHEGIVLIRLDGLSPDEKARNVSQAVTMHGDKLTKAFSVISHGDIRIRNS